MRPKNLIGGGLLDRGPGLLVEHLEQLAGAFARLQGRPSQRRHARGGVRPRHDLQEAPGGTQTDPLGLGDSGELILFVGGDLHGVLQPLSEGLDLSVLLGELPLKVVDAGLGRGAVHGVDDLLGLAIERLPRLLPIPRHLGDVTVSAAQDGEGAGDALRDRAHGDSLRRGRSG